MYKRVIDFYNDRHEIVVLNQHIKRKLFVEWNENKNELQNKLLIFNKSVKNTLKVKKKIPK